MDAQELKDRFPDLIPGRSPSLGSVNGIGMVLYGARSRDEPTATYVKTRCFAVVFMPVLAIDAWRVANVPGGGWYVLGREPLSALAKLWNLLVVGAIVLVISLAAWSAHTASPEYQDGRRLAQARAAQAAGDPAAAVPGYAAVARGATTHRAAAAGALAALPAQAAGLAADDGLRLLEVLRREAIPPLALPGLDQASVAFARAHGATAPRQALAALDQAAPRAEGALDGEREALLETLVKAEPQEARWASQLAERLDARGERPRCEELLAPHATTLAGLEGARILGSIRAGQGRHDEAHLLLVAYCEPRLKRLKTVEAQWEKVQKERFDSAIAALDQGAAGPVWYNRYKAADEAGQRTMVMEWVHDRLKGDQAIARAEEALREAAAVVPTALELGIVALHRARRQADPAAQKAGLEAAEKVFLSIRGVAGESDEYALFYAQVCWWLDRRADGRAEFDRLLERRQRVPEALVAVAQALRQLGADSEMRALTDEAWKTAKSDEDRWRVASLRAHSPRDADDALLWLSRCNPAQPDHAVELAAARGHKAIADGDDAAARRHYETALAGYRELPRTAATLNNAALVAFALAGVTGERAPLAEGTRLLEEAYGLAPAETILQANLVQRLVAMGVADAIGDTVDQAALRRVGDDDLLDYCGADGEARRALAQRLLASEPVRRALAINDRLIVQFARSPSTWHLPARLFVFAGDATALRTLRDRLRTADLDLATQADEARRLAAGERDAQAQRECAALLARDRRLAAGLTGGTAAVHAALMAEHLMAAVRCGTTVDADEVVALAERAHAAAPSVGTRGTLARALLLRAGLRHAATDAGVRGRRERARRMIDEGTLGATLAEAAPAFAADADVRRAADALAEAARLFPARVRPWHHALLAAVRHPDADSLRPLLADGTAVAVDVEIDGLLTPWAPGPVLEAAWLRAAAGDAQGAREVRAGAIARGVVLPVVD